MNPTPQIPTPKPSTSNSTLVVQGLHGREYMVAILGSIRNTRTFLAGGLPRVAGGARATLHQAPLRHRAVFIGITPCPYGLPTVGSMHYQLMLVVALTFLPLAPGERPGPRDGAEPHGTVLRGGGRQVPKVPLAWRGNDIP
jgi:hypothetical protein